MTKANDDLPPPSYREQFRKALRKSHTREIWELLYPWIVSLLGATAIGKLHISTTSFEKILTDFLPLTVSVAAIFAGFQGALHAILLSLMRSRIIEEIRNQGLYNRLVSYVRQGIVFLMIFLAASLAVLIAHDVGKCPDHPEIISCILVFLFCLSMLTGIRVMLIEVKMLKFPDDSTQ